MIKLTAICIFVVLSVIIAILKKKQENNAEKLLNNGDTTEALNIYKYLFLKSFDGVIDEEGNGHVPSFLGILKNKGTKYLGKIDEIMQLKNMSIDRTPYKNLIDDVYDFLNEAGVMNYKKVPVKHGKQKYAEFYHRLITFAETIPDEV